MTNVGLNSGGIPTRGFAKRVTALGLLVAGLSALLATTSVAEELSCPPPQRAEAEQGIQPANKKIGVSVAYLKVPFYANFKTGLQDGADHYGFTYELVDGNSGDVATELANLQNFIARKFDLIILTPSGDGIRARHQARQRRRHSYHRSQQQGWVRPRRSGRVDLRWCRRR